MANKEKKSFKKYAKKHLATVIENRRKSAKSRKEMVERVEKKKQREANAAAREEREHQEQLDRLKDTDPDFYSYLEDEDPTLLQFGQDDLGLDDGANDGGSDAETELDDEEDNEDDEAEGVTNGGASGEAEKPPTSRVTRAELERVLRRHHVEACVDIFVSAVRELGYALREGPRPRASRKFEDPSLVKESMLRIARHVGDSLGRIVTGKGAFKSHKTRYLMRRLLLALVASIAEAGAGGDAGLTAGMLHAVTPFVPVLHYMKGLTRSVLRAALTLCAAAEETVRVAAYVVVRAIATRATGTRSMYQSTAFKGIFLALVRTAHHYNIHNAPVIAFLMNCVVDLYGTDMEAAYQHAFVYLRQLAIYLRAALQQQTQSNVRAVVNWQFLNALRTWGAVVSRYAEPAQLGPLIHPVVQLATGMMDLFASPRMFPMHLQIMEVLNHISLRADGVFIPLAPYLLRILTSPSVALDHPHGGDSGEGADLQFTIRVKKSHARSSAYRRDLWSDALYLLTEHLATHSHSIGFPEAFWAVEATLKRLRGEVKVPKIHVQITALLRHMQTTSQRIATRRDQASSGPCDLPAVKQMEDELRAAGNPLVTYHQSLRKQRVEAFAAKQRNTTEERATLEAVVKKQRSKKVSRNGHGGRARGN